MSEEAGAGAGNGQGGSGAPSGGSPEGGSENDDKPITAKQLKAALASQATRFNEQLAAKDREIEAFKAGAASNKNDDAPAKRYTRAELKTLVDAGQITKEQSDDVWAEQVRKESLETAAAVAHETVTGTTRQERIDQDLESYKRLKPEIMEEGSETREKIKREFHYLVGLGDPGTGKGALQTQLKAIRAVLGPLDNLEKAANASRAQESEQQGGGEGNRGGNSGGGSKKLVDHLKPDAKDFYEKGIKSGRYRDWDAVEAELKYASPNVRRRLGLPLAA